MVSPDANDGDDSSNPNPNIDSTSHNEVTVTVGPLYAEGFGIDPNIDKVNTIDVSGNFKHDDQDLSGQQADGSFVATQDDIDQVTNIGKNYLIEHRYGHVDIQDTITYQEMSGINANFNKLSLYDYVHVKFDKYNINETEQVNAFVWDCLAHHYVSITIGKLPIPWQHLLLQEAKDQASSAAGTYTKRTQGWLNRFEDMMHSEKSDRRAKENQMMDDLGMLNHDITWTDDKGKEHKIKDVFLETRKEFEDHFQQIDDDATDIKSWIDQPGDGIIQAIPNWQAPQQLTAKSSNGGKMIFGGNGLEFYDERSQKLLTGMDSRGKLYADSIEGVKVKAMEIDALLMHGNLKSEDPNMNMKIYIGTQNPGSTLNPWKNGRVIWVTSDNYSSMVSSGQFATTSSSDVTRIHPSAITVADDMNEVLTQRNFAAHAYRRIKSWVKIWISDYLTINNVKRYIWQGGDSGVNLGKLRNLPGQGKADYSYNPGDNDDYGYDENTGYESGIDFDLNPDVSIPTIPDVSLPNNPSYSTSDSSGMLTYTQADNLGLPRIANLGETRYVSLTSITYQYLTYTPTGNNHWFILA